MKSSRSPAPKLVLVGLTVAFAACGTSGGETDSPGPDQAEPLQVATAHLYAACIGAEDQERHDSNWPWHVPGGCPTSAAYTLNDAVSECGGGAVQYFTYTCTNLADGMHAWTASFACCGPEPLGATCSQGSQCATGRCAHGAGFETRHLTPGTPPPRSAAEAVALFASLPPSYPGYGFDVLGVTSGFHNAMSDPLRDITSFGSHLKALLVLDATQAGTWTFRFGPDYGLGGTLRVDRKELQSFWRDGGVFWGGSFSDPGEILQGSIVLGPGRHEIEAYGFEDCCDGPMELDALAPGADAGDPAAWHPISAQTMQLHGVCAPLLVGPGAACNLGTHCRSGTCVNGVCW